MGFYGPKRGVNPAKLAFFSMKAVHGPAFWLGYRNEWLISILKRIFLTTMLVSLKVRILFGGFRALRKGGHSSENRHIATLGLIKLPNKQIKYENTMHYTESFARLTMSLFFDLLCSFCFLLQLFRNVFERILHTLVVSRGINSTKSFISLK